MFRLQLALLRWYLVNHEWVVTAAHCSLRTTRRQVHSRPGQLPKGPALTQRQKNVRPTTPGPSTTTIATLMRLARRSTTARTSAFLPADFDLPGETLCYTTAWGSVGGTGHSGILKQAYVPFVDNAKCNQRDLIQRRTSPTALHLRRFTDAGGHDACQAVLKKPGVYASVP
uniref:Peptidase S1 domain-containing protein n=1 Tax=Macrostomum lignano TaxID=282301 RepID=A0A1I8FLT2_9PLAT